MTQGNGANNIKILPVLSKIQANPIKIFNKACPDIMFANKRMLKLKTRAIYEISSRRIKKGAITNGTPLGKNRFKIFHFCWNTPIRFIPIKCVAAKKKVTIKELVRVNEYGINPARFEIKIKINK